MKVGFHQLFTLTILLQIFNGYSQHCQTSQRLIKKGDVMIAGLFPIHLYNSISKKYELNMHALAWSEAMIFAVNEINANKKLLQNISIGYTIHDTCNEIETAMKSVLALVLDRESKEGTAYRNEGHGMALQNKMQMSKSSTKTGLSTNTCSCEMPANRITSVIGGASSKISASISNILSVDLIPQISYSSTSIGLSDKNIYQSFLRTIPPDSYQSQFIVDILVHYNWRYVNLLASDDEYGRVGVNYLLPQLESRGICVAVLDIFKTLLNLDELENTVQKIINEKQAKVTILWSGKQLARSVIALAVKKSLHDRTWIATEAWGNDEKLLNSDPRVVAGLFGVVSSMIPYEPFEQNIAGKSFSDLYTYTMIANRSSTQNDTGFSLTQRSHNNVFRNSSNLSRNKVSNVIDAVYAFAHGLEATVTNSSTRNINLPLLFQSIKNVSLKGANGMTKMFDDNGDPTTATYSLVNLKQNKDSKLEFQVIAHWNSKKRKIEFLQHKSIFYAGDNQSVPKSKCGDECKPGFYAFRQTHKKCCWTCVKCPIDSYKSKSGTAICSKCPAKSIANRNNTGCIQLEEIYIRLHSDHGITLLTTMIMGAVASTISLLTFVVFRNTPVVRSSNCVLSILQLSVSTLAFLYPLLFIGIPSKEVCYSRPLVFGVLFTTLNSIIFNKADRLLRIFKMRHRIVNGKMLLSNKFQLFIVLMLATVSVLICLVCFMLSPPKVTQQIYKENSSIRTECQNTLIPTLSLLAFINVIGITCIVYTFKSRNLPRQYREKRYIGLAMFVATLAWISYIPLSLSNAVTEVKNLALCLSAQIANAALLAVIYGPKTWIMLAHPQDNNPANIHRSRMISQASMFREMPFVIPVSTDKTSKL